MSKIVKLLCILLAFALTSCAQTALLTKALVSDLSGESNYRTTVQCDPKITDYCKCKNGLVNGTTGTFIDSSDNNKTYKTVVIGCMNWMAENYAKVPANGSGYYHVNGDAENDVKYGLLYDYEAAVEICPDGWHLPTSDEFHKLKDYGARYNTSTLTEGAFTTNLESLLRAKSTDWDDGGEQAIDEFGFSALPAGGFYVPPKCDCEEDEADLYAEAEYDNFGAFAVFWSKTWYSPAFAKTMDISRKNCVIDGSSRLSGYSVRCIEDTAESKRIPKRDAQPDIWQTESTILDSGALWNP